MLTFFHSEADSLSDMDTPQHELQPHSVETLAQEIGRIVAERQELRAAAADTAALEANRRRLADAQSWLSRLLIARYLPEPSAA